MTLGRMEVVLIKVGVAAVLGAASAAVWVWRERLGAALGSPWAMAFSVLLLRVAPFVSIYLIYGLVPRSDVAGAFFPMATAASQGHTVYRDFPSDYSPLFPYVMAPMVRVWHDSRAIILLMMLVELAALVTTNIVFRSEMERRDRRLAWLLYLLSPASFVLVMLGGQEDVWMWLAGVVVIALLVRQRPIAAGASAVVGTLLTKAFLLIFVVPLLLASERPWRYLGGLALAAVPAAAVLWVWIGAAGLMPLRQAGAWSPPNIWFLLNAASGGAIPVGSPTVTLVAVAAVTALAAVFMVSKRDVLKVSAVGLALAWVFTYAALMLLSPKSMGNYVAIFLMPLIFVTAQKRGNTAFLLALVLAVLAAVEPSFWFRLGSPDFGGFSFLQNSGEMLELMMESGIVVALVGIMVWCWRIVPG